MSRWSTASPFVNTRVGCPRGWSLQISRWTTSSTCLLPNDSPRKTTISPGHSERLATLTTEIVSPCMIQGDMLELVTLMEARPASRLRRSRTRDSVIRPPGIPDISMISTGLAADATGIYPQSRNRSKRNHSFFCGFKHVQVITGCIRDCAAARAIRGQTGRSQAPPRVLVAFRTIQSDRPTTPPDHPNA